MSDETKLMHGQIRSARLRRGFKIHNLDASTVFSAHHFYSKHR